jgi:hypothetical protein
MFLRETLTVVVVDERQEASLEIRDCGLMSELDEFSQCIPTDGWPKSLVDQLLKLLPCRCALVPLEQHELLCCIARHVEGHKELLPDILGCLNMEELSALVDPGQQVILPITGGEQEIVAMASRCDDLVTVR